MSNFIQLNRADCLYLLELIQDMDSDTKYTERQRLYTIPKLTKISTDPKSAKLAFQDVEYLLDLIDDDDLPESEQQREMTRTALVEIQNLQQNRYLETRDIDQQREERRLKRNPSPKLQEHFARTSPLES
jgi:hypothetical protein